MAHDDARVHVVRPKEIRLGARVRVRESHRIVERRGKVGTVFGRYGGEDYVAVDVRFPEGGERLFWPRDLEKVSAPRAWWHFLLGGDAAEVNLRLLFTGVRGRSILRGPDAL